MGSVWKVRRPMKSLRPLLVVLLILSVLALPRESLAAGDKETVVLLHGLGRGASAMWPLASRIEQAGFDVVRIEYDSLGAPPEVILASVARQIDACCRDLPNRVHFVGHSLGGLVIRGYLAEHSPLQLGRVVLIASPNAGTPLVDKYRDTWLMDLAGPTAKTLGTGPLSFPNALPPPNYQVGVIAGVRPAGFVADDGIPGADDGLVPLESAKLAGMADFIVVQTNHSLLRYSRQAARQTIAFLRGGAFEHRPQAATENVADLQATRPRKSETGSN